MDNLTLASGARLPVIHYSYDAGTWQLLLHEHGFTAVEILPVAGPGNSPHHTLAVRARRTG